MITVCTLNPKSVAEIQGYILHADMPAPTVRNHEQELKKNQANTMFTEEPTFGHCSSLQ